MFFQSILAQPLSENSYELLPYISYEEIQKKIVDVSKTLSKEYQGRPIVLVMILKGAFMFASDLMKELPENTSLEYLRAKSYGGTKRGELTLFGIDRLQIEGKDVLIVDDIFDSGNSLSQVVLQLAKKNPASIKSLVLLTKTNAPHVTSYRPDWSLFEIENEFVVGYGLDYNEYFRGLKGIYIYHEKK